MASINTRIYYGTDPDAQMVSGKRHAFFWPNAPAKRREMLAVKRNMPDVFQSVYQCHPGSRTGSIFVEDDFTYYEPPEHLDAGIVDHEVRKIISKGHLVVSSWDTAFEATTAANYTVCITGLLVPCNQYHRGEDASLFGECEPHFDVYLLDLFRQKLMWGDLVARFRMIHRKWAPVLHLVEKRGAGTSLYQSMSAVGINVEGVDVTESKRSRAIEGTGAGSTQGWFRQHRVLFPENAPWLDALELELKDFTGQKDATDDQVDTIVHLTNYAIRLSQNMSFIPSEWTMESIDELMGVPKSNLEQQEQVIMPSAVMSSMEALQFIQLIPNLHDDPADGLCISCRGRNYRDYCHVQKRVVAHLDSCVSWSPRDKQETEQEVIDAGFRSDYVKGSTALDS